MAAFAGLPQRATMHVILLVARIAGRRHRNLGDVLGGVASVTIEAAVLPGQRVARLLIMIEAPSRPSIRVVAERAIGRQTPLMVVVAVAGDARQRCVFVAR